MFPLFVPQATVNDRTCQVFAAHAFCLEHGFNLAAGISGVKFIHDVQERGKIILSVGAVHSVIDGDQPDASLPQNFHDLADFEIVTPQAAHVFDDDCLHVSGLHFLHHGGKSGAVEPGSGDSIVREMGRVGKTVAAGIIFQHGFLVADGITLTLEFIVTGEPLVQRGNLGFRHSVCLLT